MGCQSEVGEGKMGAAGAAGATPIGGNPVADGGLAHQAGAELKPAESLFMWFEMSKSWSFSWRVLE